MLELRSGAEGALKSLNPRENLVIRLTYMNEDGTGKNNREIGEIAGISIRTVQRIRQRALEKLRNSPGMEPLRKYWEYM